MELSRNIMGALMDDNVDVDEVIKKQQRFSYFSRI